MIFIATVLDNAITVDADKTSGDAGSSMIRLGAGSVASGQQVGKVANQFTQKLKWVSCGCQGMFVQRMLKTAD